MTNEATITRVVNAVYEADNRTDAITRVSEMTPSGWKATTIFDGDDGLMAFARILDLSREAPGAEAPPAASRDVLRDALSALLEYCAEQNPNQGMGRDDPRVERAMSLLSAAPSPAPAAEPREIAELERSITYLLGKYSALRLHTIAEVLRVRRFHFAHNESNTGLAAGFNAILDALKATDDERTTDPEKLDLCATAESAAPAPADGLVDDLRCAGIHSDIHWLLQLCSRAAAALAERIPPREATQDMTDAMWHARGKRGGTWADAWRAGYDAAIAQTKEGK